jgi:hypothetical protein
MVLEELKRLMQSGNNDAGKKKTCYLSLLDMETNCEYAAYDEKTHLLYWIYSVNFVSITDPTLCMAHRERFEAMKKTAILLSESNEIQRAEFLGKQQHYIENIINDIL